MRLIIFGPPGSGKGTYAGKLREKFGLEKISTGDIFREEIKKGTELGKKVENFLREGKLVPDEIVIEVVREKIKNLDKFILDGFPRTLEQANALEKMTKIDAIIKVNVHPEIIIEKISGRRICSNPKCDGNYNIVGIEKTIDGIDYLLPPLLPRNDMKCDKCGSPLIQRDDDKPEIIKKRLEIYEEQSKPVIDYYRRNTKIPFVEVWMNRPPEIVVEKIIEELRKLNLFK
ncbi:MAG: nucleoside monophosphate kinase [Candidatus Aenigmatarchaeota archaeon]